MIVFFNSSILPTYHDLKMANEKKIIRKYEFLFIKF